MSRRQLLRAGVLVWVVAGAAVALAAFSDVSDDARLLVAVASVMGPLLGVGAALQLSRHADRSAGELLVLSALVTPTYFAYAVNVPALLVGVMLAVAAHRLLPESNETAGRRSAEELRA